MKKRKRLITEYAFFDCHPYRLQGKELKKQIKENITILSELTHKMYKYKNDAEKGIDYIQYNVKTFDINLKGLGYEYI